MIAYFMRYYTRTKISHGFRFHEILHSYPNISWLQVSIILHPHLNISWLQISWDITPEPKYLMMRYNTLTSTSHGYRFHEILPQNHNISWLLILAKTSCLITFSPCPLKWYFHRIKISHSCRFHEISHQDHNIS